jgi:drug/metabolite transporter (DMT)-like permease
VTDRGLAVERVAEAPRLMAGEGQRRFGAWLAFGTICLLWGTTFLGIRVAIETIPTLMVTSLRFTGAGAILLIVSLMAGARFPKGWRSWRDQAITGVVMVAIANTLVVWAEHALTSGLAALLAATIPIWMALLEWLTGATRLTPRKALGLAFGFGGVALLVAPEIGRPDISMKFFLSVGAMQLSAICWNAGTLFSRRRQSEGDPTANGALQMLAGGLAVTIVALMTGQDLSVSFSTRSVLALLYLMIFGSVVAYSAYLYALTKLPPGKLSSYAYVNPLVAVLVGSAMLGELVTLRMIVAMVVILGGVAVIQTERLAAREKENR